MPTFSFFFPLFLSSFGYIGMGCGREHVESKLQEGITISKYISISEMEMDIL